MAELKQNIFPEWACWIAVDEDGAWWCYEAEPHQHDRGWYENEVGKNCKITTPLYQSVKWHTSLIKIS